MGGRVSVKLPLSEPQERHVATILAHLERAVRDLQNEVSEPPENLVLTEYEDAIDPALAGALGELIAEMEGRVERIARELELPRSGSSILRKHLASLQLLSIDLYATLPSSGLRGYGEVAPATARYLEKEIPKLEALVNEIVGLLGRVK
jgi:hypothetical protein